MLKLSKISKVFLSAGLLLAFSGFVNIAYAGEYESCLKACESNPKEKNVEKCKQKCYAAKEAGQKYRASVGTAGWEKTERSSSQIIGMGANGAVSVVETKRGERTQDANGQKLVKDNNGNYTRADGSSVSQWEQASLKKNDAQETYTNAAAAYNKCLATKGATSSECQRMAQTVTEAKQKLQAATEIYNDVQKNASKAYWENEKAQAQAERAAAKAEEKALKADTKGYNKAQKAYQKCLKENNSDGAACAKEMEALTRAQNQLASHSQSAEIEKISDSVKADAAEMSKAKASYMKAKEKQDDLQQKYAECQQKGEENTETCKNIREELRQAKADAETAEKEWMSKSNLDALSEMRNELNGKKQALSAAEAECNKYSAMTSMDAQAKAREACSKVTKLEKEVDEINEMLEDSYDGAVSTSNDTGVKAAAKRLKTLASPDYSGGEDMGGYGVIDISQSRELVGPNVKGTTATYNFDYSNGEDVLETVTRRAALAIAGLKPIVYVFAGFGLIAFAWMAIFGKLSWKWFANIAMGLFLVANMGRFIEYFVSDGGQAHYYVGAWKSQRKDGGNKLANAFHDIYYVYGDTTYNAKGLRDYVSEADIQSSKGGDIFNPNARGFCQGTSASGWGNFTSCLKDIVATGKKAVDTAQTVRATVDDVVARVETVRDTVSNIKTAAKNMGNVHSLTDVLSNTGIILNNVNAAVSTTTGAVGSLTNAASRISNNVQDMGKSTDQQKELADRRARGEATNAFDAKLKGQEFNKTTGGVEKVDGKYAGAENLWTTVQGTAKDISDKSASLNSFAQEGVQQASAVTNMIGNTSLSDLTVGLDFGAIKNHKTANDKIAEKQEKKAQEKNRAANEQRQAAYEASNEGKNASYREAANESSRLYSNIQSQRNEVAQLQQTKDKASEAVKANCADESSALCQAAQAQLNTAQAALESKQQQLNNTQAQYELSKNDMEQKYQESLNSNINEAQKNYEEWNKKAEESCARFALSEECVKARQEALKAANQMAAYVNEKERGTYESRYDTKEDVTNKLVEDAEIQKRKKEEDRLNYEEEQANIRLKTQAADAQRAYQNALDFQDKLYQQLNNQHQDVEKLEAELKEKQSAAQTACAKDPQSAVCTTATAAVNSVKQTVENKKQEVQQTQKQYTEAKKASEQAYKQSVTANINQAEQDYASAKRDMEKSQITISEANKKIDSYQKEAEKASDEYNKAKEEAMQEKSRYESAKKTGVDEEKVAELKENYDQALNKMATAGSNYNAKSKAYTELKQQKEEAEKTYNEAVTKAKEAKERAATYTNEQQNKTSESRIDSREDVYTQGLINQYKVETNPSALAQASKNNYIAYKNKAEAAGSVLAQKLAVQEEAKKAYEEAEARAKETGSAEDKKIADRLKQSYKLSVEETKEAEKEYKNAESNLASYEKTYLTDALAAEKYKQNVYSQDMKKAADGINEYEKKVAEQRKIVDQAASQYTKAKSKAASTQTSDDIKKAAELYNEYKKTKEIYDEYVKALSLARREYQNAQKSYNESVAEQKRLQEIGKKS